MDHVSQMMDYLMTQPKLETPTKPVGGGEKDFQTLVAEKQAQQAGNKPAKGQENPAGEETKAPAQEGQADQEPQDGVSPEEQMAMAAMAAAQLNIVVPNQEQPVSPEQTAPAAVQAVAVQADPKSGQQPQVQQPQQEQVTQASEAEETVTAKAAPTGPTPQERDANQQQPSQRDLTAAKQPVEKQADAPVVTEADAQPTEKPLFRDVEAAPVKVGNGTEMDTPETETSVRNQVMDSLAKAAESGESRVKIALHPDSLGTVTVELVRKEDGALNVMLHADNLRTQSILEKTASHLQYLLADRGDGAVQVQVERQQNSQSSQQELYDQERQGQQQQEQQHQSRRQQEESDFFQQLRLGLIPVGEEEVS